MLFRRFLPLFVIGATVLAGCGFQPVYATRNLDATGSVSNAFEIFREVYVKRIADREGQYLHNRLTRLIQPSGPAATNRYVLTVTVSEAISNLAVQSSAVATRANMRVTAQFTLSSRFEEEEAYSSSVTATSGYNIFRSEFQTLSAENGARERALDSLAEQIRLRLAAHLTGSRDAKEAS